MAAPGFHLLPWCRHLNLEVGRAVHDDESRADLTGRRAGEIGQLCLALATSLRQHPDSISTRMLASSLFETIDALARALAALEDPNPLESITKEQLVLLKDDVDSWLKGKATLVQTIEEMEKYGKSLYDDHWGLADPPQDVTGIAAELSKLRDVVRSYRPENQLVVGHARWIAAGISALFYPHLLDPPDEKLWGIRERALAAMTFLENVALHTREDCLVILSEAAELFAGQATRPYLANDRGSENAQETLLDQEEDDGFESYLMDCDVLPRYPDEPNSKHPYEALFDPKEDDGSKASLKDRFVFNPGQVLFDKKDLGLPSGEPVTVLKELVGSFGDVVPYSTLDPHYSSAVPGSLPKAVVEIRKSLRAHDIPCEIKAKRGEGYLIRKVQASGDWE